MSAAARLARVLLYICVGFGAGCAHLPEQPVLPSEATPAPARDAPLDRLLSPAESAHPDESGFRLVVEGTEAFALRAHSAKLAQRSLDVQTYIWHADATGLFLVQRLLEAADRGVRVRLLVDDLDGRAQSEGYAALAAHPNVEVRMFNPFATRSGSLRLAGESLRDFRRINRRMHNKSWIADNRIALVGGRNLGDEYFAASDEVNFVDLDFAMVGPVVRDVSASFDHFWNSASAWPIQTLAPDLVNADALGELRARLAENAAKAQNSRYAQVLRDDDGVRKLAAGDWPLQWARQYRFISDDPAKVTMQKRDAARAVVGSALATMMIGAAHRLNVISPYFVPGRQGTARLIGRVQAGAGVDILTNSLAANDVASVHGGYSRHRRELIEGGVQLWELRPEKSAEQGKSRSAGSSGASLHTKALSTDGHNLFVGSYNLDPRSKWLNCEQGVIVDNPYLAAQLDTIFAQQTRGSRAWHVTVEKGSLRWSDGTTVLDEEPQARFSKKFQAWLARLLHLDAQL